MLYKRGRVDTVAAVSAAGETAAGGSAPRWATSNPYKLVAFALGLVALLSNAAALAPVAVVLILSVVFGLLLDAPVSWLARRGLARSIGTVLVLVSTLSALTGFGLALVPAVKSELEKLSQEQGDLLAALLEHLNRYVVRLPGNPPPIEGEDLLAFAEQIGGLGLLRSTGTAIALVVIAIFTAAWAVGNPDPLERRLLGFVPERHRESTRVLTAAATGQLRRWLLGQLTLDVFVAVSAYVVFRALDVPFALLFAIAAGLLENIPSLGIILSSAGPVALTLLVDPQKVVVLLICIAVIQQVEDRLIIPLVMNRAVDIPQSFLGVVILAFAVLFGPLGAFFAIPVTVAALAVHDALIAAKVARAEAAAEGVLGNPSRRGAALSDQALADPALTETVRHDAGLDASVETLEIVPENTPEDGVIPGQLTLEPTPE